MYRKKVAKDQNEFDQSYTKARRSLGYGKEKKNAKNIDQFKRGFGSPGKTSSSKVHGGNEKTYKKSMNTKMRRATKT